MIKTLELRNKYYTDKVIRDILASYMKNREVIIMNKDNQRECCRGLRVDKGDFLENFFIKFLGLYDRNVNVYISNAQYYSIPLFTNNLKIRSKFTYEWSLKAHNDLIGFDLFLDFDNKEEENREDFLNEVEAFYYLLDDNKVCFYCIFSGSGFHFVIPSNVWWFVDLKQRKIIGVENIINSLQDILELKYLDSMGSGSFRKIRKCPFSICENKVCLPIMKWDKNKIFNIDYVFENKEDLIYNQKDILKNNFSVEENRKNFRIFLTSNFIM